MELSKLSLPQTLSEFNSRFPEYEISQWSGAVNFLFVEDSLALIKRSVTMPSHKGQMGFIGGHKSPAETEPVEVALREFEEESFIKASLVEPLGIHLPVKTSRNKVIVPVICKYKGKCESFLDNARSNGEWDNIVLVKVSALEREGLWTTAKIIQKENYKVSFFPLLEEFTRYQLADSNAPYTLWGASAKMILNFFQNPDLSVKLPQI